MNTNHQIRFLFLLSCLMVCSYSIGSAQETSDSLLIEEFKPLEVVATRINFQELTAPLSVAVLGKSQFQNGQPLLTVDEVLNYTPGLFVLNPLNFSQDLRISIRGFGSRSSFGIRGIKLIVDGLPETTPDGQSQVDNLDLGVLDNIEVIKGPASGLYGNASGGVININTEDTPDKFYLGSRIMVGSFGLQQYQLKTGYSLGKFSYLVNGSFTKMDGFRNNSELETTLLSGKFKYELDKKSDLTLIVNHVNSPVANDPGGVTQEIAENEPTSARIANEQFQSGEAITQSKIGLVYKVRLSNNHSLRARLFNINRDFSNRLPFENAGIVAFKRSFTGAGAAYHYSRSWPLAKYDFNFGIDWENQSDDRERYNNLLGNRGDLTFDQTESFTSTGVFLQNKFQYKNWVLQAGIRYDILNLEAEDRFLADGDDSGTIDQNSLNPFFGGSYLLSNNTTLYVSYSTSFETPTLNELSNNPIGGGFNEMLNPQRASNYEIGIKGLQKKLKYSLTYFHIDLRDELIPFEIEMFPGRTFFRNSGRSSRDGIEAAMSLKLRTNLVASLAYTYSDFIFNDFDGNASSVVGNQIPGIPKHLLATSLRLIQSEGFHGAIQARLVGDVFTNDANTVSDDAYLLVNTSFGYRLKTGNVFLEPFFGIRNLLNTRYNSNIRINAFGSRFFEPGPDINFYTGIKINIL
ncbi:MAG: TonB-dependent receptor [Bacteroidota bacterium]